MKAFVVVIIGTLLWDLVGKLLSLGTGIIPVQTTGSLAWNTGVLVVLIVWGACALVRSDTDGK